MWPLALAALTIIVVVPALLLSPLANVPPAAPSVWPGVLLALSVVAMLALVALIARTYQRGRRARRATEQLAEAIAQDLATHGGS